MKMEQSHDNIHITGKPEQNSGFPVM
jgi:hypothetical protein